MATVTQVVRDLALVAFDKHHDQDQDQDHDQDHDQYHYRFIIDMEKGERRNIIIFFGIYFKPAVLFTRNADKNRISNLQIDFILFLQFSI